MNGGAEMCLRLSLRIMCEDKMTNERIVHIVEIRASKPSISEEGS